MPFEMHKEICMQISSECQILSLASQISDTIRATVACKH